MPPRKKKKAAKQVRKNARPAPRKAHSAQAAAPAAKKVKSFELKKAAKAGSSSATAEKAQMLSSETVFQGKLFRVTRDSIVEPTGLHSERDVVRHNGSVVILAVDRTKSKKDPWIVMERQYRHAANRFLWEIPAGKLEPGEEPLTGAKRELAEETGYQAKKWKVLAEYWPSPGFVGESMLLYLADGLIPGEARPEEDEKIELRLVKLSQLLKMIEKGAIHDGKTLIAALFYAWLHGRKRKK